MFQKRTMGADEALADIDQSIGQPRQIARVGQTLPKGRCALKARAYGA